MLLGRNASDKNDSVCLGVLLDVVSLVTQLRWFLVTENKRLNILGCYEINMDASTFKLFAIVVLRARFCRLARSQWDPQLFLEF